MFNLLRQKNSQKIFKSQIEKLIQPQFRLLVDLEKNNLEDLFSQSERKSYEIVDMASEDELLIILRKDGTIFIADIMIKDKFHSINDFANFGKCAKSFTLNKKTNTLFIVYLQRINFESELKCCSLNLSNLREFINASQFDEETKLNYLPLFSSENLTSPAFIEFDETNSKIITRNSLGTYKVWRMDNVKPIFELTDGRIEEIRSAAGILMACVSTGSSDKIQLNIIDIENGKLIINYEISFYPNLELEILEIFDNILLFKQKQKPAIVMNLTEGHSTVINDGYLDHRSLFIHLCPYKMFIAQSDNSFTFYSLKGEELTKLQNDNLDLVEPNYIHISADKNFLIVYWQERRNTTTNITDVNKNVMVTPTSKKNNICSKMFLDSASDFCLSVMQSGNILTSKKKSMRKFIDSDFSNISSISRMSRKEEPVVSNKKLFEGEFEIIALKEDFKSTKWNITADKIKLIGSELNRNCSSNLNEKIEYFTMNTRFMKVYIVTSIGRVFECAL